jgi:hypothetical protein
MTPGPPFRFRHKTIHRVSFWLGLFVACFLAWAWWDSYREDSALSVEGAGRELCFVRHDGETRFYAEADSHALDARLEVYAGNDATMQRAIWWWGSARPVKVPDSLVFFSFVGLWGGWLGWRWRVERKASASVAKSD